MCEAREQQGYGDYGGEITQGILSSPNPSYISTVFTFCSLREPDLMQALALSVSHGLAISLQALLVREVLDTPGLRVMTVRIQWRHWLLLSVHLSAHTL